MRRPRPHPQMRGAVSEHSPGPWFVHPLFQTSVMNKEGDVAEASPSNPRRFYDARLIAAAPELLAMVRELTELLAMAQDSTEDETCAGADAARALIARIEGG